MPFTKRDITQPRKKPLAAKPKPYKKGGPASRASAVDKGPSAKQIQATIKQLERLNKKGGKEQKLVKDVFADVFSDLQLTDKFSLKVFAMKNPALFYTLAAKLIPIQVSGEGGGPILSETVFR